jgi:hypothetical protein
VHVQALERLARTGPPAVGGHRVQQGQHPVPVGEQRRRRDRVGQADRRPVELDDARLRDEPGEAARVPGTRERPHPDHSFVLRGVDGVVHDDAGRPGCGGRAIR